MGALATKPGTLRTYLRSTLRTDHDKVEAAFDAFDMCTRGGYIDFLKAHWLALEAIMPTFAAMDPYTVNLPHLQSQIERDLQELGSFAPAPTGVERLMTDVTGASYVILGSSLGAAILLKMVTEGWNEPSPPPINYLRATREQNGWPALTHVISTDLDKWNVDAVIAGAKLTFGAFEGAARRMKEYHG